MWEALRLSSVHPVFNEVDAAGFLQLGAVTDHQACKAAAVCVFSVDVTAKICAVLRGDLKILASLPIVPDSSLAVVDPAVCRNDR